MRFVQTLFITWVMQFKFCSDIIISNQKRYKSLIRVLDVLIHGILIKFIILFYWCICFGIWYENNDAFHLPIFGLVLLPKALQLQQSDPGKEEYGSPFHFIQYSIVLQFCCSPVFITIFIKSVYYYSLWFFKYKPMTFVLIYKIKIFFMKFYHILYNYNIFFLIIWLAAYNQSQQFIFFTFSLPINFQFFTRTILNDLLFLHLTFGNVHRNSHNFIIYIACKALSMPEFFAPSSVCWSLSKSKLLALLLNIIWSWLYPYIPFLSNGAQTTLHSAIAIILPLELRSVLLVKHNVVWIALIVFGCRFLQNRAYLLGISRLICTYLNIERLNVKC